MYELILNELKKQGKSLYWLSKETGIAYQVFTHMRNRKTNLSAENALRVSKVLGIKLEKLIEAGMKKTD